MIPKKPKRQSWTFRVSRRFMHRSDLSLGAKGLACILLSYANKDGLAWPTTPQLAKDACISPDTVDKYLSELRDAGVISWKIWLQDGHKRRKFNLNPMGENLPLGHGGKNTPLTSTTVHAERLFIAPASWDGLGGNAYDGRRTMQQLPPSL